QNDRPGRIDSQSAIRQSRVRRGVVENGGRLERVPGPNIQGHAVIGWTGFGEGKQREAAANRGLKAIAPRSRWIVVARKIPRQVIRRRGGWSEAFACLARVVDGGDLRR